VGRLRRLFAGGTFPAGGVPRKAKQRSGGKAGEIVFSKAFLALDEISVRGLAGGGFPDKNSFRGGVKGEVVYIL